jgi:hypothetical protein
VSTKVDNPSDAIDALGGTMNVSELCRVSAQSVSNWRHASRLPPTYFLIMLKALRAVGHDADPELWGIRSNAEVEEGENV